MNIFKARLTRAVKHAENEDAESCATELMKAAQDIEGINEKRMAKWMLESCERRCREKLGIKTPLG